MSDLDDFGPEEIAAAERLDADIDRILGGRGAVADDPELSMLVTAMRTDPPDDLGRRIAAEGARWAQRRDAIRWRPYRYLALVVAYLFISQGIGNFLWGDWVADGVGESFSPHSMREAAFALMAVGVVIAASAFHRRFAPVAVASGVPLALALGIGGIAEIGEFAPGAILHLSQGAAGLALLGTYVWSRRDRWARAYD